MQQQLGGGVRGDVCAPCGPAGGVTMAAGEETPIIQGRRRPQPGVRTAPLPTHLGGTNTAGLRLKIVSNGARKGFVPRFACVFF